MFKHPVQDIILWIKSLSFVIAIHVRLLFGV